MRSLTARRRLAQTTALTAALLLPTIAAGQTTYTGFGTVNGTSTSTAASASLATGGVAPVIVSTPIVGSAGANALSVTLNARNTIIDWGTFSVPSGSTAAFSNNGVGTTGATAVLNRVTGGGPGNLTTLAGTVTADHTAANRVQVWFINTNGIVIGDGAAFNTAGLVLSTLDLTAIGATPADATFLNGGAGYNVRLSGAAALRTGVTGGGASTQFVTNGGVLALIAPKVDLSAGSANRPGFNSGTGPTAFALASDVSFETTPGGPLSITVNAGTPVAGQSIRGTIVADRVYALVSPQAGIDALLDLGGASVTNASLTPTGLVVLGDGGSVAVGGDTLDGGGAPALSSTSVKLGTVNLRNPVGGATPAVTAGTVQVYARAGTVAGGDITLAGVTAGELVASTTRAATPARGTVTAAAGLQVGRLALSGHAVTLGNGAAPVIDAVRLDATLDAAGGLVTIGSGTTLTGNTADAAGTTLTIGGAETAGLALAGSTIVSGASGGSAVALRTATDASQFALGKVTASTLDGGIGTAAATVGSISRTGAISAGDLVLSGANTIGTTLTLGVGRVTTGGALTLRGGAGLTVDGTLANLGAAVADVTLRASGGTGIALAGSSLAGRLIADAGGAAVTASAALAAAAVSVQGGSIAVGDVTARAGAASLTATGSVGFGTIDATGAKEVAGTTITGHRLLGVGEAMLDAGAGGATIDGGIGTAAAPLAALTVNGALALTGSVYTSTAAGGTQRYGGPLTIAGDATLSGYVATFGAGFSVRPAVSGTGNLVLAFAGAQRLDGGTFSDGTSRFASLTVGPAGGSAGATTALTGRFTTTSGVTFNNAATLAGDVIVDTSAGGDVSFNAAVDAAAAGGQGLTVNTAGVTRFAGPVGRTAALRALTTDGGGSTTIAGDITAASQTYGDAVTVTDAPTLTAATALRFDAGLAGTAALTLAGAGTKAFAPAGGIVTIGSLTTSGGTLTVGGGGVTTTGAQRYGSPVSLGGAAGSQTSFSGASGAFDGGLLGNGRDLALVFGGTTRVDGGAVTDVANLRLGPVGGTAGATTSLVGTVVTTGTQTYNDAVRLGSATTGVTAGAAGVSFNGSVDATSPGVQALSVTTSGTTTFAAPVGQAAALAALSVGSGPVTIGSPGRAAVAITTVGSQSYAGLVTLASNAVLSGSSIALAGGVNGTAGGTDHDLTLTIGAASSLGDVGGIGDLLVNGGGLTTLTGPIETSGTQHYANAVVLGVDTTLTSGGRVTFDAAVDATSRGGQGLTIAGPGDVSFGGAVGAATPLAAVTVVGGTTRIGGGSITTTGNQSYGAVLLGADTLLGTTGAASGIAIAGTLDGGHALRLSAAGTKTLGGTVGGTAPLASLTSLGDGTTLIDAGTVTTTGNQFYGAVALGRDTVLTGAGGSIGAVGGGGHALTATFAGTLVLGAVAGITTLIDDGAGSTTLTGDIATSGSQRYANAVTLASPVGSTVTLRSTGGGAAGGIAFATPVDAATPGGQSLVVDTAGQASFAASVGGRARLAGLALVNAGGTSVIGGDVIADAQSYAGAVTVTGASRFTAATGLTFGAGLGGANGAVTLDGGGAKRIVAGAVSLASLTVTGSALALDNGGVTISGAQRYDAGLTLGADTVLTGTSAAASITTASVVANGHSLTLDSAGAKTVDGATVSGLGALATRGTGTTTLSDTIVTSGGQTYDDAVVLAGDTTASAGGDVAFNGTVDAATAGGQGLAIVTPGTTSLAGRIGGSAALASLTTGAGGVALASPDITTLGAQSYGGAVTLRTDTVLTSTGSGAIGFAGSVDGAQALTIATAGTTRFAGPVGGSAALTSLTTDAPGSTLLAGGGVVTTGAQTYGDAVTLGATTALVSTDAGAIRFAGALDGGQALSVDTGGTASFAAAVGGTAPLASLTVTAGSTALNGGSVVTTGAQSYAGPVTFGGDARLTSNGGGALTIAGTVDGAALLSLTTAGAVRLGGVLGGTTPLTGLSLRAGTVSTVVGNRVGTLAAMIASGGLSFDDADAVTVQAFDGQSGVVASGAVALSASGGLTLAADVAGSGVTLAGGGIGQAAGTRVDGGAGAILLDGRGGTVSLAGSLATRNGGGEAVRIIDAAAVTLGSVATGAGGTLTLGTVGATRIAGDVAQTSGAAIDVGVLTGTVGGKASLTNAGNRVATLGAFTGNGLALRVAGPGLTVGGPVDAGTGDIALTLDAGALVLAGDLIARSGTVALVSGGTIGQDAGTIVADTLAGSAVGGAALTATGNQIARLGGFTVVGGGLSLTDGTALTLTGDVAAEGDVGLTAAGLDFTGRTIRATGRIALGGGAGAATGGTVLAGGGLTATGSAVAIDVAQAAGALALTATGSGGLTVGSVSAGAAATLVSHGDLSVTRSLTAGGAATVTANGAATLGETTAGGALTVTANGIAARSSRAGTALAFTSGGALTVDSAQAGSDARFDAKGVATLGTITAGGVATVTAGGAATLGTIAADGALTVAANGITAGLSRAGTALTFTSGGGLTVDSAKAGGEASFDANGTATLGTVTAGSGSSITVRAADAQIDGVQTAGTVAFVNRQTGTAALKLGDGTSSGGFQLSQDEIARVAAGNLVFDGRSGDVEVGALAFGATAGSTSVSVLTTGRLQVLGTVSGSGAGRVFRLGGTASGADDKAGVIEVVATAGGGGRLLFDTADLELRGNRIGVGQAPGFLTPLGFDGATGQSAAAVASGYVANPNSALYNASLGGAAYRGSATLVSAHALTVRYRDYALFQNTGQLGTNTGVTLGGITGGPAGSALNLQGQGAADSFALFGTINGIGGTAAALLGPQVIGTSRVTLVASRVNGCLIGSGAGCLSSVVAQPVIDIFDASRFDVFRAADDLAVPFDPVVSSSNEALFSGVVPIEAPITGTDCTGSSTPECRQPGTPPVAPPARVPPPAAEGQHR